jgi:ankyrin repeat protein
LQKQPEERYHSIHLARERQAASFRGHEHIVKLLLDNNTDINAQGRHYGNALQAAAAKGHEQIVELLLDKNADVNAQVGVDVLKEQVSPGGEFCLPPTPCTLNGRY